MIIEATTVALLGYIGFTDARTFTIQNGSVLLLLLLYALYALVARSPYEILSSILLGAIVFAVLLCFYAKRTLGAGDVKLLSVVCLWIGIHCAFLFSTLLLLFIFLHLAAARMGWVRTRTIAEGLAIPYAPAVTGALIGTIALGCL